MLRLVPAVLLLSLAGCAQGGAQFQDAAKEDDDAGPPMVEVDAGPGEDAGAPVACDNGLMDGDESDVDCGGSRCDSCSVGQGCASPAHCDTGVCAGGVCAAASCTDGVANGTETDNDCGGGTCPPCAIGGACLSSTDCQTSICAAGVCAAATCLDGLMNGSETDVDCGSAMCPPCAAGQSCSVGTDCTSGVCQSGTCVGASCTDGSRNGSETDVDCGGACDPCDVGQSCSADSDCTSGTCGAGTCAAPASCQAILAATPSAGSGPYMIQPDPGVPAVMVYCDMQTDGGGWTLVAASRTETLNDQASSYYADLAVLTPTSANAGIWSGMRSQIATTSDVRFTCRAAPAGSGYDVDMSFYAVDWYREFTTGTEGDSCFSEGNGAGYVRPAPGRRDNRTATMVPAGTDWMNTYLGTGDYLEGEDSCTDTGDFTIDLQDRGMDSNQSDGTDWGEDDSTRKCGTSGLSDGIWQIWVR